MSTCVLADFRTLIPKIFIAKGHSSMTSCERFLSFWQGLGLKLPTYRDVIIERSLISILSTYHQLPYPIGMKCTCHCPGGICHSPALWARGSHRSSLYPHIQISLFGTVIWNRFSSWHFYNCNVQSFLIWSYCTTPLPPLLWKMQFVNLLYWK